MVKARILQSYRPAEETLRGLAWVHGKIWTLGNLDSANRISASMAHENRHQNQLPRKRQLRRKKQKRLQRKRRRKLLHLNKWWLLVPLPLKERQKQWLPSGLIGLIRLLASQ